MLQSIRKFILTIATGAVVLLPLAVPATVAAACTPSSTVTCPDVKQNLCAGATLDVTSTDPCDDTTTAGPVNSLIGSIINLFSIVVGVVSVIMIIVGGLKYITSGGDSGNITGAKNTILYAIIGLVVVAIAQFLVRFVLGKVAAFGP